MDTINIVLYDYFHWNWTDIAVIALIFVLCFGIILIFERK